jgi:hypothetical protein
LKIRVLFLCTGKSCRSQLAEGWVRQLKGDRVEVWSAGIETHGLSPRAVQMMAEAGVDISGRLSKDLDELVVGVLIEEPVKLLVRFCLRTSFVLHRLFIHPARCAAAAQGALVVTVQASVPLSPAGG